MKRKKSGVMWEREEKRPGAQVKSQVSVGSEVMAFLLQDEAGGSRTARQAVLLKSLGSHFPEPLSLLFHSLKAGECSMTLLENSVAGKLFIGCSVRVAGC